MGTQNFTKAVLSATMDLKLTRKDERCENISTLCTDIFLIVIKMRESEDLGETSALRKLILYYLREFDKNCSVMGVKKEISEAVKYALVALLDETVLSIPGEARDFWVVNPMQLELFGNNIAGREFFNKLSDLIQSPRENRDALEVFYLCLSLGFYGKYKLSVAQEREKIIGDLAKILVRNEKDHLSTLSPHAIRSTIIKYKAGVKQTYRFPLWAVGTIMCGLIVAFWFIMRVLSNTTTSEILNLLK
ncbi:MAG: type IVB secretion system protein IcmH/DotU [Bacteroidota bacterium]